MTDDQQHDHPDEQTLRSRRIVLRSAIALSLVGALGARRAIAHDDNDDDDNEGKGSDNSGHGGGDDHDAENEHGIPPGMTPVSGVTSIAIVDERFDPPSVIIDPGQTITWTNQDDDAHSATSRIFDTGILAPGQSGDITFTQPGTFPYQCVIHPEMQGEVIVRGRATPEASPVSATPSTANTEAVKIIDFAFDPPALKIATGTTVTWTNSGQAPHTVNGPGLDSGTIMPGSTFSHTFTEPGMLDYACAFHPQMTATIEVG
jgi:plastocyanin